MTEFSFLKWIFCSAGPEERIFTWRRSPGVRNDAGDVDGGPSRDGCEAGRRSLRALRPDDSEACRLGERQERGAR